jgi:hypothetical protein
MKGTERATKNERKGLRTFLPRCPRGRRAARAMLTRPTASRPKTGNEEGGVLTPTRMKVRKTMIFARASRRWTTLSMRL